MGKMCLYQIVAIASYTMSDAEFEARVKSKGIQPGIRRMTNGQFLYVTYLAIIKLHMVFTREPLVYSSFNRKARLAATYA